MKFAVIVFPGSNCDADCYHVVDQVLGAQVEYRWHKEQELGDIDCVILPGGFSYGDYLRSGAIACFSPIVEAVRRFGASGGIVFGICNGFQILLEMGLLPGGIRKNANLRYICRNIYLRVENAKTPFTCALREGEVLKMPIAHNDGNYFCDEATLHRLDRENRVVLRYVDREGEATVDANPNGSLGNIAGIMNEGGNILGMMPHPDRCAEAILGNEDGRAMFASLLSWVTSNGVVNREKSG